MIHQADIAKMITFFQKLVSHMKSLFLIEEVDCTFSFDYKIHIIFFRTFFDDGLFRNHKNSAQFWDEKAHEITVIRSHSILPSIFITAPNTTLYLLKPLGLRRDLTPAQIVLYFWIEPQGVMKGLVIISKKQTLLFSIQLSQKVSNPNFRLLVFLKILF